MAEPTMRLLMPSAGRKVGLVRALSRYFKVYVGGLADEITACRLWSPGNFVALPPTNTGAFYTELLAVVERLGINVILPVRNEDMAMLGIVRKRLADAGVRLVMSPDDTVAACIDKAAMFVKLASHHYHSPVTFTASDWEHLKHPDPFPLFIKDRYGAGSRAACRVDNEEQLRLALAANSKLIIQPFINGQEYTLDMFFDGRNEAPVQAVLRKRVSVLNGQMDGGEIVPLPPDVNFQKIMNIGHFFKFCGPINIQFIQPEYNGQPEYVYYITDINPRFGGGIGLTIASGADFAAYLLELVGNGEIIPRPYKTGLRAACFFDYAYGEREP